METLGERSTQRMLRTIPTDINPENGLGEELFLTVSSLVPIVNVDLLVFNEKGQFILRWRDDPYCGTGWHVPGGCIRFKETSADRISIVAQKELGINDIKFDAEPIKVFEIINHEHREIGNQNERGHFITLVYKCYAPGDFIIEKQPYRDGEVGFMQWFDHLPENMLSIQSCYKEIIK